MKLKCYKLILPADDKILKITRKNPRKIKHMISGIITACDALDIDIINKALFYDNQNKYPLIQYTTGAQAIEIIALEEGLASLHSLFPYVHELQLDNNKWTAVEVWLGKSKIEIAFSEINHLYKAVQYIPLNQDNFKQRRGLNSHAMKALMKSVLMGHIRGMAQRLLDPNADYANVEVFSIKR